MNWHAYNKSTQWYTGTHETEEGLLFAVDEPLPDGDWRRAPVEGQAWPRWARYRWELEAYVQPWRQVWVHIKELRDSRKVQSGFKVGEHWFHSDEFSRGQQLGLVLMGDNIPPGLMWKTMSGEFVPMTPALAQQLLAAGAAQDHATFAHAEALRAQAAAAADPFALDLHTGWPLGYGESAPVAEE